MRLVLLMGLSLAGLWACSEPGSVEDQIKNVIGEMEQDGEEGRRGAFMKRVHPDFQAQSGQMDKTEFKRYMVFQWNQNSRLHAQLFPITVTEDWDQQASARFNVLVTGGRGFIPERGQLFEVFTIWQQDGSDWLLLRADWKPVEFEGILPGN